MALFESLLSLLLVAVLLLRASRWFSVPYPSLLALAGVGVAALPFDTDIAIEPHLVLALFIAPALLDSAYDTSPREIRRHWLPLTALAVVAVMITAATVAWVGWRFAGLPVAVALTLGAIVAPPDAAAANAVLARIGIPRRSQMLLQGESLLNDASALLIYGAAMAWAMGSGTGTGLLQLGLAAPGGILFGFLLAYPYLWVHRQLAGTLSATVLEFTVTFGTWLVAERLSLSPVLAVVTFAMAIARHTPAQQPARDRVQSLATWSIVVFVLNVLAFLLMGLQARSLLEDLPSGEVAPAISFAIVVLVVVILVRLAWLAAYHVATDLLVHWLGPRDWLPERPPWRLTLLIGWCGMRGLLTLATAFALPPDFPHRSSLVLAAFAVVLGTLVLQGLTITPLMRWMGVGTDQSLNEDIGAARQALLQTALKAIELEERADVAESLRTRYCAAVPIAESTDDPQGVTAYDRASLRVIAAQRECLEALRRDGRVADDVYRRLEEELDWAELDARPFAENELRET